MKYPNQITPWKDLIINKWVIFDTDAIISIIAFGQIDILDEMKTVSSGFATIHPVQLELMNTNNAKSKLERSKLLIDYDFIELPLGKPVFDSAKKIQDSMPVSATALPADLYLGATLVSHHDDRFVLTANIKDFPMPIFTREGYILLQDDSKLKLLTLLSMDKSKIL